jgi:hypothetical protein
MIPVRLLNLKVLSKLAAKSQELQIRHTRLSRRFLPWRRPVAALT